MNNVWGGFEFRRTFRWTPGCSNLTQMERFSKILWIYSCSSVWERTRRKGLEKGSKTWQVTGRTICHIQEGQLDLFNQLKASDWHKGWHKLHITTMASCHALRCFSLLSAEEPYVVTFTFSLLHTIIWLKKQQHCFLADGYMSELTHCFLVTCSDLLNLFLHLYHVHNRLTSIISSSWLMSEYSWGNKSTQSVNQHYL